MTLFSFLQVPLIVMILLTPFHGSGQIPLVPAMT